MYSDQLISEIIAANDIVDYVSQYVRLKGNGRDYVGLCPFHKEKSPSFHVNRDKQFYHCFGCNAGGNLIKFVRQIEGLDFLEALKLLADRAGIILPEDGDVAFDNERHRKIQKIYEINKVTARFFYDNLTKTPEGKTALEYLYNRQITNKTIIAYGLGYSPDKYDALLGHLRKLGYSDADMIEAGVVASSNGKIYDRFFGRVMFPIIDLRGNVIGFGGRVLSDKPTASGKKPAKYLNTSNTPAFDKGRNLFSLNLAKKSQERRIILCEGYMDVISVYQAGIPNIVATLGTALTENQAKLLMRYCSEILLCYDSDAAGQAATMRAIDIINSVGGKARVMQLNGAKDPDEYIKKNGVAMFRQLMDESLASSEFLIGNAKKNFNLDTEEGKIGFVEQSVNALVGVKDGIEVDAYIKKISKQSDISVDAIYAEYRKKSAIASKQQKALPRIPQVSALSTVRASSSDAKLSEAEMRLLSLCCLSKALYTKISSAMKADDYSDDTLKKIAMYIYDSWESGKEPEPAIIANHLSEEEEIVAAKVFCIADQYTDNENAVDELIVSIKKGKIELLLEGETNPAKIMELIKMRDNLGRK